MSHLPVAAQLSSVQRWWIYQQERFPLLAHGVLIAAFSFSTISYSRLARGHVQLPGAGQALAAFLSAFLFFLLLRIADEFKDHADDCRYRPYRPVPRGIITLPELGRLGGFAVVTQAGLVAWQEPALLIILLGVWTYFALMSKEFFVAEWLKARPVVYLVSHMLLMPLIDFYVAACDWLVSGSEPPAALTWLVAMSFTNGLVVEIGRKIRCPADEETGVETYSRLWGYRRATGVWLAAMACTAAIALAAAAQVDFAVPATAVLGGLVAAAAAVTAGFLRCPGTATARRIEHLSGLWTVLLYLTLGTAPLLWALAAGR